MRIMKEPTQADYEAGRILHQAWYNVGRAIAPPFDLIDRFDRLRWIETAKVRNAAQPEQGAIPHLGADGSPPVFGRRWKLAKDGFGLQRDDENGNYVHIDDALSVLHQSAQPPMPSASAELLGNPKQLGPRQLPTNCRHCGGPDDVICGGQCRRATDAFADAAKAMHPVQEPETAVYIRKDQLQKAAQSAMLCEVTPEPRQDRIRIYTTPVHGKPLTREQDIAMREGHHISASDKYFAARFTLVTISHLKIFEAGFDRGWNAAHGITGDTK